MSDSYSRRALLTGSVGCAGHVLTSLTAASAVERSRFAAVQRGTVVVEEPFGRLERLADGVWALISTPLEARATLSNGGIVAGSDGVLLIEGFASVEGAQWMAAQAYRLTGKRPTHVVLTHYHGDHSGGLAGYRNDGDLPLVFHTPTTRELLEASLQQRDAGGAESPVATLADEAMIADAGAPVQLDLGGRTVSIAARVGHTPSDLSVRVEDPAGGVLRRPGVERHVSQLRRCDSDPPEGGVRRAVVPSTPKAICSRCRARRWWPRSSTRTRSDPFGRADAGDRGRHRRSELRHRCVLGRSRRPAGVPVGKARWPACSSWISAQGRQRVAGGGRAGGQLRSSSICLRTEPGWPSPSRSQTVSATCGSIDSETRHADALHVLQQRISQAEHGQPLWSPDGKWLAYISNRNGTWEIYRKPADGVGEEELLLSDTDADLWSLRLVFRTASTSSTVREIEEHDNSEDLIALPVSGEARLHPDHEHAVSRVAEPRSLRTAAGWRTIPRSPAGERSTSCRFRGSTAAGRCRRTAAAISALEPGRQPAVLLEQPHADGGPGTGLGLHPAGRRGAGGPEGAGALRLGLVRDQRERRRFPGPGGGRRSCPGSHLAVPQLAGSAGAALG